MTKFVVITHGESVDRFDLIEEAYEAADKRTRGGTDNPDRDVTVSILMVKENTVHLLPYAV